ncbi:uncharacterized protein N7511_009898 [Penicillium nucicola]|uniref:uncharacterized protein n=1 Tax=Penicillium nucicola TaxID=1850975 RepID=UPI002545A73D|nr:uncharacterized protein N7511_009898 [Penicillium nucicola]KAJ5748202.1 hypothetical protein N7511_009898 [Penicillium nucicola]
MQAIFQRRDIRRKLQKQFVTKYEKPENVWTHEGRYSYQDGEIHTISREPEDDLPAQRRREHGHRTIMGGPAIHPRHSVRAHLERDGDVERADFDPELQTDPHTINTHETLGATANMMITGIERARPGTSSSTGVSAGSSEMGLGEEFEGDDIERIKKNKLIIVTYEGECDSMDPHNWSFRSRLAYTLITSGTACVIFWSSTIDATALVSTRALFHTSFKVQTLPTTLFLIMNGLGALVAAPISEVFGRTPIYIPSIILFMLFNMGAGLSQTAVQRIVCRAFAGLFGSAPAVLAAATLVDIWSRIERVYMFPLFSVIAFTGPLVGPTPGAFVVESKTQSWRWVDWITIIFASIVLMLVVLFLPETYSPILLDWKAKELRRMTGDDRFRAPLDFKRVSFLRRLRNSLYRPILLFVTEPIISVHALYLAVEFIILYTFLAGYVSIYMKIYHWSAGLTAVAFLGIEVGVLLAVPAVPLAMYFLRREIVRSRARGQIRPDPEISLYMGMFGAPAISISMFWMGWTARESISFWSPLASSVLLGFGVLCIFVSSYQYIADSFELHAASALASLQVLRLVASGVMAIISEIMYMHLGVAWTLTVLGCISLVFLPVPFLLYWKGPQGYFSRGENWFHEIPFLPHGWETTNVQGSGTLKHAAMKALLQDQSQLKSELFEIVPWHLAKYLWDALGRCNKQTLHMWKLMATMYPAEFLHISPYYCLCTGSPREPIKAYMGMLNTKDFRWRAVLTLASTYCSLTDFSGIPNIKNLVALEICKSQEIQSSIEQRSVSKEQSSLQDGSVRGWVEMWQFTRALQHLRILRIYHQQEITAAALRSLRELPELQLVVMYGCNKITEEISRHRKPSNNMLPIEGWSASRLDWLPREKALADLGPLLDVYKSSLETVADTDGPQKQTSTLDTNLPILEFQLPTANHHNPERVAQRALYRPKSVVLFTRDTVLQNFDQEKKQRERAKKRSEPVEGPNPRAKKAVMKDKGRDLSMTLSEFF